MIRDVDVDKLDLRKMNGRAEGFGAPYQID